MSALFGIWRKDNAPTVESSLDAMERALCEWQCDTRRVRCEDGVGLGVRLLYTTPESHHEKAPFQHAEFPHLILAADAWLDNRAALCDTFQIPHSERATTCDSELILRAYVKWGEECADKLRGDFAFALWDSQKQQWYCARDFIGSKPLFYFDSPLLFCFASDVRGVLACPGVPNTLDTGMLATYLSASTSTAEKQFTFYQTVFKIPPGHFLVVAPHTLRVTRYWSPDNAPDLHLSSPAAYAEQTRALLEQAAQNATRTPFRVGAHLSGGLDSTTVAILAAREMQKRGERMNGYSWSPPPSHTQITDAEDERHFIQAVCQAETITPHYVEYSSDAAIEVYTRDITRIPREMALREEQTQNQAAQDGVRVLLSGWGGDELISYSGRGYLPDLFRHGAFPQLHREIVKRLPPGARGLIWARAYGSVVYRQLLWFLMPDLVWQIHSPYQNNTARLKYIRPEFLACERAAVHALRDPLARDYPNVRLTQTARLEHGHLTRRMESWATHGAKRGIVYRYPLVSRELVEFSLGLPPQLYFADGYSRAVLRRATRGILPETLRTMRTKAEPVAIGIVSSIQLQALDALYKQTQPRLTNHPAAQYVNVAAIQKTFETRAKMQDHTPGLLFALSCFYMTALQ